MAVLYCDHGSFPGGSVVKVHLSEASEVPIPGLRELPGENGSLSGIHSNPMDKPGRL